MKKRQQAERRSRAAALDSTSPGLKPGISNIAIIIALAALLKLIIVWQLADHPLVQPEIGLDTTAYAELARRVVNGDWGLGPGLYYVSPLYIYVLAAGLGLTGSFTAVRVLQVLAGALAVAGIWTMTRAWSSPRAAWFAAVLAAFTGLITFYEVLILQASIDVALTTAALLALTWALKADDRAEVRGTYWFLITGLVLGLASLNRPNFTIAAAGMAAVLLLRWKLRPLLLLSAGVLIGIAPVAIRNIVVADQWSLVSSHGGLNFYMGNGDGATGFYREIPGITPDIKGQRHDARRVAEQAVGRSLTDAETSDYFMDRALTWMRQNPGKAAGLFLTKLAFVFHAQHVALPYSYPFFVYDAGTSLRLYAVGPWLLIPLGLIGLVVMYRQSQDRSNAIVWLAFVPVYAVSVAIFFVAERYRLPLLVPLIVGSGVALDALAAAVAARQWRSLIAPVLVFIAGLGLANWTAPSRDDRWNEGLRMTQRLAILDRDAEAEAWVNKLSANAPHPGEVQQKLGLQYMLANKIDLSLKYLREAQRLNPGEPDIEYTFGQALLRSGNPREALPHLRVGFDGGTRARVAGFDLAVALEATGDPTGAAAVLAKVTPAPGDDAEVWLQLGRLAASVKAPEQAERFFKQGAALAPNVAGARLQYGLSLLVLNRMTEAAAEFEAATRLDPRDADALAHLAYCELVQGRKEDARRHADAALAIAPAHALAAAVRAKT